jgi:hypothetical protein
MGILDATGLGSIFDFGSKVLDKIFPDPVAAASAKVELLKLQQSGELAQLASDTQLLQGQIDINKIDAASEHPFQSYWRPFIGWVCGSIFAYNFLVQPFLVFSITVFWPQFGALALPHLDLGEVTPVLMGLLGLGYMRTREKIAGIK